MRNTIICSFFNALEKKFQYAVLHHIEDVFCTDSDIDLIVDCTKKQLIGFIDFFCSENKGYYLNHTIDIGTHRFNLIFFKFLFLVRT